MEIETTQKPRMIRILQWLPSYQRAWLPADLLAGLVAAAVVIPQAIAYASIAGLPVQVGLYVALAPMLVYALLGSSRPLSVSSTSTISLLVASSLALAVQSENPNDFIVPAATLAFMVGVFLLLAAFLRFGFIANFISLPVLTGFKAGIGVVIVVGELNKVLGLSVPKGPVFRTLFATLKDLGQIHWPTFAVALATLAILLVLPRLNRRIPAALVAVIVGILAAAVLSLEARGVKLVGLIPPGLPRLSLPDWRLFEALWPGALGIALMSFVESIAAARTFMRHDDPPVDANQELFALGLANIAGGFTQAFPAGGGTSQTAVNDGAGARSQIAGIVTVAVAVVTLLFLAPLIALMPQATLGALVLVAAAGLVKVGEFQKIARFRRVELWWALVASVGVMLLGTLQGILVAIIVSILVIMYFANRPPVYAMGRKPGSNVFRPLGAHPEDETFPGLLILRSEGMLYFGSAPRAIESYWALIRQYQPRVVVLECSAIPNVEYTALRLLADFEEKLADAGIVLWLAMLNPNVMRAVDAAPFGRRVTRERMFFNLKRAVAAFLNEQETERDNDGEEL
jgi:sulfate permease, SulP family